MSANTRFAGDGLCGTAYNETAVIRHFGSPHTRLLYAHPGPVSGWVAEEMEVAA